MKFEIPWTSETWAHVLNGGAIERGPTNLPKSSIWGNMILTEPPLFDALFDLDLREKTQRRASVKSRFYLEPNAWFMHEGRVLPGILGEAAQGFLILMVLMGACDGLEGNPKDYACRMLDARLIFHDAPPQAGETVIFTVNALGYSATKNISLLTFAYQAFVQDRLILECPKAQAGYFLKSDIQKTQHQLSEEWQTLRADLPFQRPPSPRQANQLNKNDFCEIYPGLAPVEKRHFQTVTQLDPQGGQWQRGFIEVLQTVEPSFFSSLPLRFPGDPCMLGSMMLDAVFQAMALYLFSQGYAVEKPHGVLLPTCHQPLKLACRKQIGIEQREARYAVHVVSALHTPYPSLAADVLIYVDHQLSAQIRVGISYLVL